MAWSVLQSAEHAAVATTNPVTFASNVSAGTKLIAVVAQAGSGTTQVSTVKDGAGNTFTLLASCLLGNSGGPGLGIWAIDTPAGDVGTRPTITATISGSADSSILVQEVSGLATGTTLAAMADGTPGTKTGTTNTATGSPTYTSAASAEYLVAVYGDTGGPLTFTKPAALTLDTHSLNSSGTDDIAIAFGNSTGGAEAGSWGLTGTATQWGVLLLAFRLAAGGGGPLGAAQVSRPPPAVRRLPQRARTGLRGLPGGGYAGTGPQVVAVAGPPPPAVPVVISRRAAGRARAGRGAASAGVFPAVPAITIQGSAALGGAGSLAAAVTESAAAGLAGSGTLASPVVQAAGGSLAGAGALAAPATQGVTAALAGAGVLTAATAGTSSGTATLTGAGTLTAASVQQPGAALTGAGTLASPAVQGVTASVTGAGTLTAAGTVAGGAISGTAILTGAGSVTARTVLGGTAQLTAAGALSALAIQRAGATLAAAGTMTAAPGIAFALQNATSGASVSQRRTSAAAVTRKGSSTPSVSDG